MLNYNGHVVNVESLESEILAAFVDFLRDEHDLTVEKDYLGYYSVWLLHDDRLRLSLISDCLCVMRLRNVRSPQLCAGSPTIDTNYITQIDWSWSFELADSAEFERAVRQILDIVTAIEAEK